MRQSNNDYLRWRLLTPSVCLSCVHGIPMVCLSLQGWGMVLELYSHSVQWCVYSSKGGAEGVELAAMSVWIRLSGVGLAATSWEYGVGLAATIAELTG